MLAAGTPQAALNQLAVLERRIETLVRTDDLEPSSAEALLAQLGAYARSRVYFTAEALTRGSPAMVFALSFAPGTEGLVWATPVAGVNTSTVLRGGVLYVGTSTGQVHALSADTGAAMWTAPWETADGAVKDFVFPDRGSSALAFSTASHVHLIRDDGASASAIWPPPVPLVDPNVPLIIGGRRVIVADASGTVYALDANVAAPVPQVFGVFGNPARPRAPGLPFFDTRFGLYLVGTEEGVLYAVQGSP